MANKNSVYATLAWFSVILALLVIMAGAFTRLSDAGLGCPDWPGCYGQLTVPMSAQNVEKADKAYPNQPVQAHKAWIEMGHRYIAGTLGILIFILGIVGIRKRESLNISPIILSAMMAIVILQALLGMWTVTLKLMPIIVCAHLLGGFTVLSLLWWVVLKSKRYFFATHHDPILQKSRGIALLALLVIIFQVLLGGWTSANYAALVCDSLPFCHSSGKQAWDFAQAFQLWVPFDHLSIVAKQTIQMTHRIGAIVVTLVTGYLGLRLLQQGQIQPIKRLGFVILFVLACQIVLGLLNILLTLPLPIAVLHNGFAALLLLSVVTANYVARLPK